MSPYIFAGLLNKSGFLRSKRDNKKEILLIVSDYTKVKPDSIKGRVRLRPIVYARHLFCFMCREYTHDSLLTIGRFLHRDHTTVIHSLRSLGNLQATEEKVRDDIKAISGLVEKLVQR